MATKNNCSASIALETPTCKFYKNLKGQEENDISKQKVSTVNRESLEEQRGYAICGLSKSKATYNYYQDLANFELFHMKNSAEILKVNVDNLIKKDAELGKTIKDTSKLINDLQVKLHEANNTACSMRNCLQSLMSFKDDKIPIELECVTKQAKQLSKHGKDAADAIVNVAGIHTFSSLEILQPFATRLIEKLSALQGHTDSLISKARESEKKTQAELTDVLKNLNKEEFESCRISSNINAYDYTSEFICKEAGCQSAYQLIKNVNTICEELVKEKSKDDSSLQHLQGNCD